MTAISTELRYAVAERARQRCEYCHLAQESQVATFPADHIIPSVKKGATEFSNLALACPRCNAQKWTYTDALDPTTGQRVPLFNPRAQEWAEHFRWSAADSAILEPLSASGRATLALLDMNSPHHVLIRRWLQAIGKHPGQ